MTTLNLSDPQIAEDFHGCMYGEQYLIAFIKKYLRTQQQKQDLFAADLELSEVLNGRYDDTQESLVNDLFADWNTKLGQPYFG